MMHLVMLAIASAVFLLLFAFVAACDRLIAQPREEQGES